MPNLKIEKIIFLATLIFLTSCKEEKPNPCKNATPVTAEFTFRQHLSINWLSRDIHVNDILEVDTVLLFFVRGKHFYTFINFKATATYDSVKWMIGDDPRVFTDMSKTHYFEEPIGKVDVRCIVYKKPNKICFPEDDGIDTLTQSVYILSERYFSYPFEGKFEGFNEDEPSKLFTVTIKDFGRPPPIIDLSGKWYGIRIHGLPEGCGGSEIKLDYFSPRITSNLYRSFFIRDNGSSEDCPNLSAFGEIINDELTIKYSYTFTGESPYIIKTFKGKKIK